ncbi:NCS2 family permease [Sinorhizobium medicae]|uniref:NCS2 family permease n=5 Tax=Sinorhizobium medicae TaxID=110321 RepID=UPI000FD4FE59|nr:NCS2 family permease [Sinorhizobium medicae]MDX0411770.1 NCS2 family permease [Sinorhizobium medicae]MDX0424260.1 NCS2 family permease [Sinorhizobium medicae]MDX0474210.1 NCS2 family permease [Sinorhizobium medicae]MDX0528590.1 NCS2 family permease [Sinorhizobium medicae]MDX0594474.1 NCS2 family permease [Sinorhizobium medicae]
MNYQSKVAGDPARPEKRGLGGAIDRLFEVTRSGSTIRTEIIAALTTFLAASYVIVVNPAILQNAGIPFSAGVTATVLVSFIGSCAMGLYARSPILVAPGMGINALFAYTMVMGANVPLEIALGCVFWAGVLFTILAMLNLRTAVIEAIPKDLRYGIACGIGLFIALIGLENAKFIVASPDTIVALTQFTPVTLTFVAGFIITAALVVRRIPGAMMAGMIITTVLAIPIGRLWGDGSTFAGGAPDVHTLVNWSGLFAAPDFSFVGRVDLLGALQVAYAPFIFVFLFTNFVEALSTFLGLAEAANLKDESGMPRNIKESMHVDAVAALISAPLGTSPATVYLESGAGIAQGGRTGLVAFVAGLLFLPFLFLSPLLSLVPAIATAPVLILTGLFMSEPMGRINWADMEDAIPAFLAIVLIPLTFSITLGLSLAIIAFVVMKLALGKISEIRPVMWFVAVLAAMLVMQVQ